MLVGVVVNVALVGLLAPYARIGQPSASQGFLGRLQRAYGALPSRFGLHSILEVLFNFMTLYYYNNKKDSQEF